MDLAKPMNKGGPERLWCPGGMGEGSRTRSGGHPFVIRQKS